MYKINLTLVDIQNSVTPLLEKNGFRAFIERHLFYIQSNANHRVVCMLNIIINSQGEFAILFDSRRLLTIMNNISINISVHKRKCDFGFFNENKDIILELLSKEILDVMLYNIELFKINTNIIANRNMYDDVLQNIEEYCRKEKLKIATDI